MASGTMESKQDQRKILLEEYRAAQAFKRAASLGINGSEASKSAGKARTKYVLVRSESVYSKSKNGACLRSMRAC